MKLKSIHILVTGRCNLKCVYCRYRNNKEISLSQIFQIIDFIKRNKIKKVAIGGGEPLLYEYLDEFLDLLKDLKCEISITTNGTIIRPIEANYIHISYDKMHNNEKTIKKACRFYSKISELGINHILTTNKDLDKAIKLCKEENIKNLLLVILKKENKWIEPDLKYVFKKVIENEDIRFMFDSCLYCYIYKKKCKQGINSICITSDFRIKKCSNDYCLL